MIREIKTDNQREGNICEDDIALMKGKNNYLRTLINYIYDRHLKSPFEERLLNLVLGFSALLTLLSAATNRYLDIGIVVESTTIIAGLFFVGLLYISYCQRKTQLAVFLLITTAFYILIPVIWLFNAGTMGGSMVYLVLFSSLTVALCNGSGRIFAIGNLLVITGFLMFIEYNHPEWIFGYADRLTRFQDISASILTVVFANAILLIIVLHEYKKERINLEKSRNELLYLSYHDAITGIYNRTYFEAELKSNKYLNSGSVGIFVFDVDGLKIINDTFGHSRGDQLLVQAAQCLKNSFSENAAICRIGGDEFAIIIQDITLDEMEDLYKYVQNNIINANSSINMEAVPLKISGGYAYSAETGSSIEELFRNADNKMYRQKLSNHIGDKGSLVQTIQQILLVRDIGTGEHVCRAKQLILDFGRMIQLSESELSDLILLAEFHDIGKVGIPDRILNKPGPLLADERVEMEKHTEIGYRIAQTSQELRPIAQWILEHHEWWDGTGYPLGISGEAISHASRILAIVDAYDAMMSDRPYRTAMNKTQALDELVRFAGRQFDPVLTHQFVTFIVEGNVN